jgi:hypothetical protein
MRFRDERHNLMAFAAPGASRRRRRERCEFKAKYASHGSERRSPFHQASSFGRAFRVSGEISHSHTHALRGAASIRASWSKAADAERESTRSARTIDRKKPPLAHSRGRLFLTERLAFGEDTLAVVELRVDPAQPEQAFVAAFVE